MTDTSTNDALYKYKIGMQVKHPRADLGIMLQPLGIQPRNSRVVGERMVAPDGSVVGGKFRYSFWNWSKLVEGERHFMLSVSRLVNILEPHKFLLHRVVEEGGVVAISLALPSLMNIGSALDYSEMARLVELKTNLNIELFPDLGNFV